MRQLGFFGFWFTALLTCVLACDRGVQPLDLSPRAASPISQCAQRTNSNPTDAMLSSDCIVFTDSTSNAITETLPAPTPGRWLRIKDKTGQAGTHNVTVVPHGGETIDGQSSLLIPQAYGAVDVMTDGVNWSVNNPPHLAGNVTNYCSDNTVVAVNGASVPAAGSLIPGSVLEATGATTLSYSPALFYAQDWPAKHGWVEWNEPPSIETTHTTAASGAVLLFQVVANTGGPVSNVWVSYATAGSVLTAASSGSITGAVSDGGLIEITQTAHGYVTNYVVTISGVVGTTEANGAWVITVVDANHYTLNGSAFVNAYSSGGTAVNSSNAVGIYSSIGAFLSATGDQVSNWESGTPSVLAMPLATPITLTFGNTYWVALTSKGSGTQPGFQCLDVNSTAFQTVNGNLTAANYRYATNPGSGAARLPASINYASNAGANNALFWVGLN
jgi:hypothetical protein